MYLFFYTISVDQSPCSVAPMRGLRIIWSLQIRPPLFFLLLMNILILTYQFVTLALIQNLCNLLSLNTYFFLIIYGFLLLIALLIEICLIVKSQ